MEIEVMENTQKERKKIDARNRRRTTEHKDENIHHGMREYKQKK
jgi:hypothetical protein